MLRVIVELHPDGDAKRKKVLGELRIANINRIGDRAESGDYAVQVGDRQAFVRDHKRLTEPVWVLVAKALFALGFKA